MREAQNDTSAGGQRKGGAGCPAAMTAPGAAATAQGPRHDASEKHNVIR